MHFGRIETGEALQTIYLKTCAGSIKTIKPQQTISPDASIYTVLLSGKIILVAADARVGECTARTSRVVVVPNQIIY